MSDLNEIYLTGKLGTDVEIKFPRPGLAVANVDLAISRSQKKKGKYQKETVWIRIVAFNTHAHFLARYDKGSWIGIRGSLTMEEWNKKRKHFIIINHLWPMGEFPPKRDYPPKPEDADDEAGDGEQEEGAEYDLPPGVERVEDEAF